MNAQVTGGGLNISQILEAAQLHSGISDDDLSEIGNAVADWKEVIVEIELFLGDVSQLDRACMAMMMDAVGNAPETFAENVSLSRQQLYSLTQRLIFSFGGRAKETMSKISEVFGATVAEEQSVGLREFRGFLASVLTQLQKERELQNELHHGEEDLPAQQNAAFEEDANDQWLWPASWLEGAATSLLQRVDDIALKLDDLVEPAEPDKIEAADHELVATATMHFRSPSLGTA